MLHPHCHAQVTQSLLLACAPSLAAGAQNPNFYAVCLLSQLKNMPPAYNSPTVWTPIPFFPCGLHIHSQRLLGDLRVCLI